MSALTYRTEVKADLLERVKNALLYSEEPDDVINGSLEWCLKKTLNKDFVETNEDLHERIEKAVESAITSTAESMIQDFEKEKDGALAQCKTSELADRLVQIKLDRAQTQKTAHFEDKKEVKEEATLPEIQVAGMLRETAAKMKATIATIDQKIAILQPYINKPELFMKERIGRF